MRNAMIFTAAFAMTAVSATTVSAKSSLHLSTNKVSTSSKYISGKVTPNAKIIITRYGKTYAKGKSNKKGAFKIRLHNVLSSGWKYRMTISKKGYSVKRIYMSVPKKAASSVTKTTPYLAETNPNADGNFSTSQNTATQTDSSSISDSQITQNLNASPDFAAYMDYRLFTNSPESYNDWLKEHDPSRADWQSSTNNDNGANPSNNVTPSNKLTAEQIAAYNQELTKQERLSKGGWDFYNTDANYAKYAQQAIEDDQQHLTILNKVNGPTIIKMTAIQNLINKETDPFKLSEEHNDLKSLQNTVDSNDWQYGKGGSIQWWQDKLDQDQFRLNDDNKAMANDKKQATDADEQIQSIKQILNTQS